MNSPFACVSTVFAYHFLKWANFKIFLYKTPLFYTSLSFPPDGTWLHITPSQGDEGRTLPLQGQVGFELLPDQLVNKCVNQGFDMNILCVGETGIGKSTLLDCLFKANFDGW